MCEHVATKVSESLTAAPRDVPKVDVTLGSLKPLVVNGFIEGIQHFGTPDGKALILKGFEKAGVTRCFGAAFQKEGEMWMLPQMRATPLDDILVPPDLEAAEVPPSAVSYVGEDETRGALDAIPLAVADEELLDLIDRDKD